MRTSPLRRSVFGAMLPVALAVLAGCDQPPRHQNLVVVVVDSLRSDHLPGYGYPRDTAPFLTRLGSEGIQVQGYAATPDTRPSVATLLTGLYPQRHQVLGGGDALPPDAPYLPELLRRAGYATAAVVSNPQLAASFGFDRGFDDYRHRIADAAGTTEDALAASSQLEPPFLLYVHYLDPHKPYLPERPWGRSGEDSQLQPRDLEQRPVYPDTTGMQRLRDQYDGEIVEVDRAIERLFEGLERQGLLEETLVVVTADHGEAFGEHGRIGHGAGLHAELLRVPMLFWSRNAESARYRSASSFHHVDFVPTALAALGRRAPEEVDGRRQWRKLATRSLENGRDLLFSHADAAGGGVAIVSGSHKLIHVPGQPDLVYDVSGDPRETRPLALPEQELVALRQRLARRHEDLAASRLDPATATLDAALEQGLRSIGEPPPTAAPHLAQRLEFAAAETPGGLARQLELPFPRTQLLSGWLAVNASGAWARPTARLLMPLEPGDTSLVLRGHMPDLPRTLVVSVDGQPAGSYAIGPANFEVVAPLPAPIEEPRAAVILLEVSPPVASHVVPEPSGAIWLGFEVR